MTDIFTQHKRKEIMQKVKNRNTNIELILRKELFKRGYRYGTKSSLFGKPDIIFPSKRITIFCDGDFWHGKNYSKESKNYKKFWKDKIKINIERDKLVNKKLRHEKWTVLRFWKKDILKNPNKCVDLIEKVILNKFVNR